MGIFHRRERSKADIQSTNAYVGSQADDLTLKSSAGELELAQHGEAYLKLSRPYLNIKYFLIIWLRKK
jgi:hypothetical protein